MRANMQTTADITNSLVDNKGIIEGVGLDRFTPVVLQDDQVGLTEQE